MEKMFVIVKLINKDPYSLIFAPYDQVIFNSKETTSTISCVDRPISSPWYYSTRSMREWIDEGSPSPWVNKDGTRYSSFWNKGFGTINIPRHSIAFTQTFFIDEPKPSNP